MNRETLARVCLACACALVAGCGHTPERPEGGATKPANPCAGKSAAAADVDPWGGEPADERDSAGDGWW